MLFISSQHKLFSLLVLVLLRVVVDLEVKVESREARCGIYTPRRLGAMVLLLVAVDLFGL